MKSHCLTSVAILIALAFGSCQQKPSDRVQGYIEGEFVYVASPLPGALQTLHVQRGAEVKVGDPLFELDGTMEKAARDQARAALVLSEAEFKRQEEMFGSGVSAAQELDQARTTFEGAQARVDALRKQGDAQRATIALARATIHRATCATRRRA